jgi:hypothetical protein
MLACGQKKKQQVGMIIIVKGVFKHPKRGPAQGPLFMA